MKQNIILIVCGAGVGLIGRYIWDRFLSQSSRVTVSQCKNQMTQVQDRLQEGTDSFKRINSCLAASCLVMLRLCEKSGIDCQDIRKIMVESGLDL